MLICPKHVVTHIKNKEKKSENLLGLLTDGNSETKSQNTSMLEDLHVEQRLEICWLAEQLLVYEKALCPRKFV
jgi:hypothetical protein